MKRRNTIALFLMTLLGSPLLSGCTSQMRIAITDDLSNSLELAKKSLKKISSNNVSEKFSANRFDFYLQQAYEKGELGDHYGAISDYNKAIEIDPKNALAYYNRGTAKGRHLADYYGAISDFTKAIEIKPTYGKAYNNRGRSKSELGDKKGACADYKKALSLGNEMTVNWFKTAGSAWCRDM